ncbi:MAG: hypothetical protein KAQ62_18595, partial [Cyclobacteriaceae bacterium]|nr:hypothetical protein [Cyclobacteriaceae bacterium]
MKRLIVLLLLIISNETLAQEMKGFLYGTVTLKNEKSYTGQLKWGNHAGAFDDLFEAYKNEAQIQEQIDIQGYEKNKDATDEVFEFSFMKLWENKESKASFTFKCQYGHIDKIFGIGDNKSASLMMKSGERINLRRRTNDIGSDVILYHTSLGTLEFDWQNIKEIDFKSAPRNLKNYLGKKVYGKVLTIVGPMEGF